MRCAIIHLATSEPPRLTMPVTRFIVRCKVLQQHAAVDRHVVDALLGLMLHHVKEMLRCHLLDLAAQLFEHLVNRNRTDGNGRRAMMAARISSIFLPVDRSMTVSAPKWTAVCSFSSSPSMSLVTAELPMLAFTLHRAATPIAIGPAGPRRGRGWPG